VTSQIAEQGSFRANFDTPNPQVSNLFRNDLLLKPAPHSIPNLWKRIVSSKRAEAWGFCRAVEAACVDFARSTTWNTGACSNEKTTTSLRERSLKIQVKIYFKKYLTEKKGRYRCRIYYIYLPRSLAEPLVGRNLKATRTINGILVESINN